MLLFLLTAVNYSCKNVSENSNQTTSTADKNLPGKSVSKKEPEIVYPSNSADTQKIDEIISDLGTGNAEGKKDLSNRLIEIIMNNPDSNYATSRLISETARICSEGETIYSPEKFYKVQYMSNILAELQRTEALEVLVDCSNRRIPVGGLSSRYFATMEAITKFKEQALPVLKEKLSDGDDNIKCQITSALNTIGGDEAQRILKEAAQTETDQRILGCINQSIRNLRR
jgi:hypothetical protein